MHENEKDLRTEPTAALPGGATGHPDRNTGGACFLGAPTQKGVTAWEPENRSHVRSTRENR